MQCGEEAWTGDLYADFPETPPGKKYNSILALPVIDPTERVVAAVTIDSSEKHHFDIEVDEIVVLIQPLIGLLGWTIRRAADSVGGIMSTVMLFRDVAAGRKTPDQATEAFLVQKKPLIARPRWIPRIAWALCIFALAVLLQPTNSRNA